MKKRGSQMKVSLVRINKARVVYDESGWPNWKHALVKDSRWLKKGAIVILFSSTRVRENLGESYSIEWFFSFSSAGFGWIGKSALDTKDAWTSL